MTDLPWSRPRHELVLLALVAAAMLSVVQRASVQDSSRLCLTRALVHGRLTIEPCAGDTIDRAVHDGRTYTDKAPGLSVVSLPAALATRLPPPARWPSAGGARLWAVRVLVNGVAFLLAAFAVGRIAEGLAPGCGGAALVTFALGTLFAPLAATTFGHVLAGSLAFGGFVLAWSRRFVLGGLLAGTAVVTDYTTALIALVLAAYVLSAGARPLARFAAGAAPPLAGLGAYDWAAFGSPFHLSYRYVANVYSAEQRSGFFGVHLPTAHGAQLVLAGDRGLLVTSPVAAAAAAGLVLLARRRRREAVVCGTAFLLLLAVNCGYFDPYGGGSPGPRLLVPALPFLALGLAPAFAAFRAVTAAAAAASVAASTALALTWASVQSYPGSVWEQLGQVLVRRGDSLLVPRLAGNVLAWAGLSRLHAAAAVCALAAAAFALSQPRGRPA